MSRAKISTGTKGDAMRADYDFQGGVRGKHARAMEVGYTIAVHNADGTTTVKQMKPPEGTIVLAPDVRSYFPDAQSVNEALRSLIRLIPAKGKRSPKARGV